jgi:ParB-like chromosome segregation protein Spo0J
MKPHPFADAFPMLDQSELRKLADDIQQNGQHQPILVTEDGQILDGRNRWAACERAGIKPVTKVIHGDDEELLKLVVSMNLHRRHLNESQRGMVAAKLADLKPGQRASKKSAAGIQAAGRVSQQAAAKALNVSRDTVQGCAKIRREGSPETIAKVERGELSAHAAMQQIKAATAAAPTSPHSAETEAADIKPVWRQQKFTNEFAKVLRTGPKGREKAQVILTECLHSLSLTSSREDQTFGKQLVRMLIYRWSQKFGLPDEEEVDAYSAEAYLRG